jgi:hypothetical protein
MSQTDTIKNITACLLNMSPGVKRSSMDMLYLKMLEIFEDQELHTYKEIWEKVLKDLYPLGWNKGTFENLEHSAFIKRVDRGGINRSIRYKITKYGLETLRIARLNQKVFNFLRHFKDKDKDDYFSALMKKSLESGKPAFDDVSSAGILKTFEALYAEENREAFAIGNYEVYEKRFWNLISKTNVLDEIISDPIVLETLKTNAFSKKSSDERHRWFNAYDRLRSILEWKERVKRSHSQS